MSVSIVQCKAQTQVSEIDQNEIQGVRWFSKQELIMAIQKQEITDGLALTGLLLHVQLCNLDSLS